MARLGADAVLDAAQRADAMLESGDMDGCAVWKRITRAVDEMQRRERVSAEGLH